MQIAKTEDKYEKGKEKKMIPTAEFLPLYSFGCDSMVQRGSAVKMHYEA